MPSLSLRMLQGYLIPVARSAPGLIDFQAKSSGGPHAPGNLKPQLPFAIPLFWCLHAELFLFGARDAVLLADKTV